MRVVAAVEQLAAAVAVVLRLVAVVLRLAVVERLAVAGVKLLAEPAA